MAVGRNLVKICPLCGHRNEFWAVCCTSCQESLQQVEAQPGPEDPEPPRRREPAKTERPEPARPVVQPGSAQLECCDEPGFTFALTDGSTCGCDPQRASIDLSPLPRCQYISGRHASFIKQGDAWMIRDEGSTNGTFVNGHRITPGEPHALRDQDVITLANSSFTFRSAT